MEYTISAVILAGGKARRMNGADKGLQLLQNKPLISHVIERLQPQVVDISINANRHHAEYAQWGFPVFSDELPDFQGPLSGMLTALEQAKTDFVLFVPCDSPYFPQNLLEKLKSAVKNDRTLFALVIDFPNFSIKRALSATTWLKSKPFAFNLSKNFSEVMTCEMLAFFNAFSITSGLSV